MRSRILFGASLIAVLVGVAAVDQLVGRPYAAAAVIAALTIKALLEVAAIMPAGGAGYRSVLVAGTVAMIAAATTDRPIELVTVVGVASLMIALLVVGTLRLQFGAPSQVDRLAPGLAVAALSLLWIVVPMTLLVGMAAARGDGRGTPFIGFLVLLSKCGDIGGYLVGTLIGKRRILPRVSPKKSWEGSVGGLLLTLAFGLWATSVDPNLLAGFTPFGVGVFAVAVNLATQVGDFAESMVKRSVGVKDSGNLLPGFGGGLDIIDSLVVSMPVAWIGLSCFS